MRPHPFDQRCARHRQRRIDDHFKRIGTGDSGLQQAFARQIKPADGGVLVDVETAPPTRLPIDDGAFDLAVADDTGALFSALPPDERVGALRELFRVLRPGGRVILVGAAGPSALGALLKGGHSTPSFAASGDANGELQGEGFISVRTLAEREGQIFVEGIKPRQPGESTVKPAG